MKESRNHGHAAKKRASQAWLVGYLRKDHKSGDYLVEEAEEYLDAYSLEIF